MQSKPNDWYKHCWTLDIQNQSWTESTVQQVDFLIEKLNLSGNERILDLACGFGRHALEFARRGCNVTGVDITRPISITRRRLHTRKIFRRSSSAQISAPFRFRKNSTSF